MTTQEKLRIEQNQQTASIILQQLTQAKSGTNRLNCMIGGYNFCCGNNYVSFRFKSKNKLSANYCKITLNGLDLYDIEFGRVHGMKYFVKETKENVYNDQLKELFERLTGLYLSL